MQPGQGFAYLLMCPKTVARVLLGQSIKKAPGLNMQNFQALRLTWSWDVLRIISLV